MRPVGGDGVETDHLFLEHPISRWPILGVTPMRDGFEHGTIITFVPEYDDGATLPAARTEQEWLVEELGAIVATPDRETFIDLLQNGDSEPVMILHFAGHGRTSTLDAEAGIRLHDEWVTLGDVDHSGTRLGDRDGCLVVMNACETAASSQLLGLGAGWGEIIATRNFGGLIAPLWKVQDAAAFRTVQLALTSFVRSRDRLGESILKGRRATCDQSVAAFAFLAHGDVMARMR